MKRYQVETNGTAEDKPSFRAACSSFRAELKRLGSRGRITLWDWSQANSSTGTVHARLADWQDGQWHKGRRLLCST